MTVSYGKRGDGGKHVIRSLLAFLVAVLVTYAAGAWLATQHVLGALVDMGMNVTFEVWAEASLHDLVGMFPTYAPLLAVALALGLLVAVLIARAKPGWRRIGYVTAGFVAVMVMHLIMRQVLELTPVAATRTGSGLIYQGLAGAIGGYVFWRLGRGAAAAGDQ